MSINKQSNIYTVIYIIVLVVIVGAMLAWTAMSLKPYQTKNISADKMRQILASVHVTAGNDVVEQFDALIVEQFIVNTEGQRVDGDAFDVDVAAQVKLPDAERQLPVYVCQLPEESGKKYILPMYGAGLWGPIWGYIAINSDGKTIYGAYFAHQGETPGLGAEIEKPAFSNQFDGKSLFPQGSFMPVAVLKKGLKPAPGQDYVDAISGGTITSSGVSAMIANSLTPYQQFLSTLND